MAIIDQVEGNTGLRCFDQVPTDEPAPFYYIELISLLKADTKTMFRDKFKVWIHAIADGGSSVDAFSMIDALREALSEDLQVPNTLLESQQFNGLQVLKTDETGEKHAVTEWEFLFCYGYKMKADLSA